MSRRMADAGIYCRIDSKEERLMHHKFMIVDRTLVVTGSFNWTKAAANDNRENVIVVDDKYFIDKYSEEFKKLMDEFPYNEVEK